MKDFFKILIIGGFGGIIFLLGAFSLSYNYNFFGSARLLDQIFPAREVQKIREEIITFVSEEEKAGTAIQKSRDSIVAIKSYRGGSLMRFGSGIVITQDGLIATVNQVVPQNATNYQVFVGDKILNAEVVSRSVLRNLALLKIDIDSLRSATFKEEGLEVGNVAFIIGKIAPLQKPELFVNRAFVSFIGSQNNRIILDGRYEDYISGAGLVSGDGSFRGLVYIDGQRIIALPSTFVEEFVKNYLK